MTNYSDFIENTKIISVGRNGNCTEQYHYNYCVIRLSITLYQYYTNYEDQSNINTLSISEVICRVVLIKDFDGFVTNRTEIDLCMLYI